MEGERITKILSPSAVIVPICIGIGVIGGRCAAFIVPFIVPRAIIVSLIVPVFCVFAVVGIIVGIVCVENDWPPAFVTGAAIRAYAVGLEQWRNLAYPLPEGAAGLRPGLIVFEVEIVSGPSLNSSMQLRGGQFHAVFVLHIEDHGLGHDRAVQGPLLLRLLYSLPVLYERLYSPALAFIERGGVESPVGKPRPLGQLYRMPPPQRFGKGVEDRPE